MRFKDARLPCSERNRIASYLSMVSTTTGGRDVNVEEVIRPLAGKGYRVHRESIDGWNLLPDGLYRKDYIFSIEGYDDRFMVSLYADDRDWKVREVNAYFTDSKAADSGSHLVNIYSKDLNALKAFCARHVDFKLIDSGVDDVFGHFMTFDGLDASAIMRIKKLADEAGNVRVHLNSRLSDSEDPVPASQIEMKANELGGKYLGKTSLTIIFDFQAIPRNLDVFCAWAEMNGLKYQTKGGVDFRVFVSLVGVDINDSQLIDGLGDKNMGTNWRRDSQWAPGWDMEGMWAGVKRDEANRDKTSLRIHSQNCDEDIAKLRRNVGQLSGGTAEDKAWIPAYEATILELEKVKKYIERSSAFRDSAFRDAGAGELSEHVGKSVKNDGKELAKVLGVTELRHTGNYQFTASFGGKKVNIATEPLDDNEDRIRILSVRVADSIVGSKMFKVTDRKTGKVHIARAVDSLDAISKVARVRDAYNVDVAYAAEKLWERLKKAFNEEAATYDPNAYNSKLGSVGPVERREVCRSNWWKFLKGDLLGADYREVTDMIERAHHGERLATGVILFGS